MVNGDSFEDAPTGGPLTEPAVTAPTPSAPTGGDTGEASGSFLRGGPGGRIDVVETPTGLRSALTGALVTPGDPSAKVFRGGQLVEATPRLTEAQEREQREMAKSEAPRGSIFLTPSGELKEKRNGTFVTIRTGIQTPTGFKEEVGIGKTIEVGGTLQIQPRNFRFAGSMPNILNIRTGELLVKTVPVTAPRVAVTTGEGNVLLTPEGEIKVRQGGELRTVRTGIKTDIEEITQLGTLTDRGGNLLITGEGVFREDTGENLIKTIEREAEVDVTPAPEGFLEDFVGRRLFEEPKEEKPLEITPAPPEEFESLGGTESDFMLQEPGDLREDIITGAKGIADFLFDVGEAIVTAPEDRTLITPAGLREILPEESREIEFLQRIDPLGIGAVAPLLEKPVRETFDFVGGLIESTGEDLESLIFGPTERRERVVTGIRERAEDVLGLFETITEIEERPRLGERPKISFDILGNIKEFEDFVGAEVTPRVSEAITTVTGLTIPGIGAELERISNIRSARLFVDAIDALPIKNEDKALLLDRALTTQRFITARERDLVVGLLKEIKKRPVKAVFIRVAGKAVTIAGAGIGLGLEQLPFDIPGAIAGIPTGRFIEAGQIVGAGLFIERSLARIEQFDTIEEQFEEIGAIFGGELFPFGLGVRAAKPRAIQLARKRLLLKTIKKLPKNQQAKFKKLLSTLDDNAQIRTNKIPVRNVNFNEVKALDSKSARTLKNFLQTHPRVVVGGSVSQRTQTTIPLKRLPGDIDLSDPGDFRANAKQLVAALKAAGVSRVSFLEKPGNTIITIGGEKAIEYKSIDQLIANIQQVTPAFSNFEDFIKNTPDGTRVLDLEVQLKRKLVGGLLPGERKTAQAIKDLADFDDILNKVIGEQAPRDSLFKILGVREEDFGEVLGLKAAITPRPGEAVRAIDDIDDFIGAGRELLDPSAPSQVGKAVTVLEGIIVPSQPDIGTSQDLLDITGFEPSQIERPIPKEEITVISQPEIGTSQDLEDIIGFEPPIITEPTEKPEKEEFIDIITGPPTREPSQPPPGRIDVIEPLPTIPPSEGITDFDDIIFGPSPTPGEPSQPPIVDIIEVEPPPIDEEPEDPGIPFIGLPPFPTEKPSKKKTPKAKGDWVFQLFAPLEGWNKESTVDFLDENLALAAGMNVSLRTDSTRVRTRKGKRDKPTLNRLPPGADSLEDIIGEFKQLDGSFIEADPFRLFQFQVKKLQTAKGRSALDRELELLMGLEDRPRGRKRVKGRVRKLPKVPGLEGIIGTSTDLRNPTGPRQTKRRNNPNNGMDDILGFGKTKRKQTKRRKKVKKKIVKRPKKQKVKKSKPKKPRRPRKKDFLKEMGI